MRFSYRPNTKTRVAISISQTRNAQSKEKSAFIHHQYQRLQANIIMVLAWTDYWNTSSWNDSEYTHCDKQYVRSFANIFHLIQIPQVKSPFNIAILFFKHFVILFSTNKTLGKEGQGRKPWLNSGKHHNVTIILILQFVYSISLVPLSENVMAMGRGRGGGEGGGGGGEGREAGHEGRGCVVQWQW